VPPKIGETRIKIFKIVLLKNDNLPVKQATNGPEKVDAPQRKISPWSLSQVPNNASSFKTIACRNTTRERGNHKEHSILQFLLILYCKSIN
jgi:hypothetical protein